MKILIATDGSSYGDAAVKAATERPWSSGAEIRVLTVMEPQTGYGPAGAYAQLESGLRTMIEQVAASAAQSLRDCGLDASHAIRQGFPVEEIINEAKEWGADLIIVGTHGRKGLSRFLLGSVAQSVAVHAHCSVEIVRQTDRKT